MRMLRELGNEVEDLVVVTADMGKPTRVHIFWKEFPSRYFNVGISEQHMISFAAGLASVGARPVVVAFSIFLMRAWEQIRNSVDRMNLNVKIIGTHAGFSDHADGASHQALEDIALMRVLPNMKIVIPADVADIERSLSYILKHVDGPLYYRIGRDFAPPITVDHEYKFELGKGYILREGSDVAIIGAGTILYEALVAAEQLEREGIYAAVVNLLTVKPIDSELLENIARKTGRVVTVEEHMVYGGIGSAVAEVLAQKYPTPIRFIGTTQYGRSGRSVKELWDFFNIDTKAIVGKCRELVKNEDRGD
ncbi:MAG: transketolase family protein [Desulfurococcaceae archaeon]